MRSFLAVVAVAVLTAGVSTGQEKVANGDAAKESSGIPRTFVVQFTEFRLNSASDPNLTAEEVVRLLTVPEDDKVPEVIETVRLSTLERQESMVQFGKRAAVTVGQSFSGPGRPPVRQTQMMEIGTAVHVLASSQEGKILLEISYEASRFEGEGTDDSPPEIVTVHFKSTLLLEPGKPMLVGGRSAETSSFLLVSIAE